MDLIDESIEDTVTDAINSGLSAKEFIIKCRCAWMAALEAKTSSDYDVFKRYENG